MFPLMLSFGDVPLRGAPYSLDELHSGNALDVGGVIFLALWWHGVCCTWFVPWRFPKLLVLSRLLSYPLFEPCHRLCYKSSGHSILLTCNTEDTPLSVETSESPFCQPQCGVPRESLTLTLTRTPSFVESLITVYREQLGDLKRLKW